MVLGYLGAAAYPGVHDNFLATLGAVGVGGATRIAAYAYGWFIIGLGVPPYCIYARYNLIVGRVAKPALATTLGVVLPWAISWTMYQGE